MNTKTAEEKPDFHDLACEIVESFEDKNVSERSAVRSGMEKVWSDHVSPLKIELSNYAYQIDSAKRDRDKAESENEALKKRIEELEHFLRLQQIANPGQIDSVNKMFGTDFTDSKNN